MTSLKRLIGRSVFAFFVLAPLIVWFAVYENFPIVQDVLANNIFGTLTVARPLVRFKNLVVVFADTKKFHADEMAHRIAQAGDAVAIVDTTSALNALTGNETHCLDAELVMEPVRILANWSHSSKDKHQVLAGIEGGGLLSFLSALTKSDRLSNNLSVGFSVKLPEGAEICAPLTSAMIQGRCVLTSAPALQGKWLAAWTDQPESDTAVFVRGIAGARAVIEPYNTPLDTVTINEIAKIHAEKNRTEANSMPVVEVPAKTKNDTITLFYSGDGGWRDLDRTVAGLMAERGYPVVGVDTLRNFWKSKTPEESAADLTAMMAHYRTTWKAKTFVLAGYSFGADILPATYNRLSEADRESVALLVFLALGKTADFEIHVSGWIGKSNDGLPILPELNRIQGNKILCIFGHDEKADTACTELSLPGVKLLELPGGHHFDQDYPKLTTRIIDMYHQTGLLETN